MAAAESSGPGCVAAGPGLSRRPGQTVIPAGPNTARRTRGATSRTLTRRASSRGSPFAWPTACPGGVINSWREEILMNRQWRTDRARYEELQRRVACYEDAGRGECHLGRAEIGAAVRDALVRFDGERYQLLAWCVMPNHVHVLIKQRHGFPLADIVRSWKSFTARKANAILGRSGRFWMREYHDRRIRDEAHLSRAILYIENNPVKAGLCERPEDWPWSSAKGRAGG